ncbi:MAG TPA: hypothetical protein VE999_03770 [Gemmataceae bacterium]|nr:hypothetical protein [Bryobacteraceae bacterium]HZV04187.1 hypothetical protein [Gemmataceae bacterium]
MVSMGDGQCRIIMRDGLLLPGMTMPVLGPPPPDPHPNAAVHRLRETWNLNIIAWEGVFNLRRPMTTARRILPDLWRGPNAPRSLPMLLDPDPSGDDDE